MAHFITLVMLTAYVFRIIFDAQFRWVRTPLDLPLIALFLLATVSSFSSVEWYSSLVALIKLANCIIVYFIIVNTIKQRDQFRRVAYTITIVGSFMALFGMIKYLGGISPPWWDFDVEYNAMVATFGCKNHLAGYMEMAIPITIGLLIGIRKGWAKALCGFALVSLCIALTLSLSRGGWMSGLFALALMLIIYLFKTKGKYSAVMATAVAVTTVVVLTILASTPVVEKLGTLTHGQDMPNWQSRTAVWAGAIDLICDHPLLGTGPGTFAVAFTPYRPAGVNARFLHTHNDFLHFVSETGILTVGIMLWLVGAVFWSGIRKIRATNSRLTLGITLGSLTGILAITIHSVADFNLHTMANAILLTVLAGLLMARISPYPSPSPLGQIRTPHSALRTIVAIAILLFFATGSYYLYRMFMGDYYIAQAKEIEKGKDWNTAIPAYQKAIEYAPANPEYHLFFGEFYLMFATAARDRAIKKMLLQKAWRELEEAKKGSPKNARTYLALAQTSEAMSRLESPLTQSSSLQAQANPTNRENSTEQYYQTAVSLYPNNTQYRYLLARYYKRAGRLQEALRQLETMIILNPGTVGYVRRNPFNDIPGIEKAVDNGLWQALDNRFTHNNAASILASRLAEKQKWLDAASVYKQAMPKGVFADRTGYYLKMGQYLLRGGEKKEAEDYFFRAIIIAPDRHSVIRSLMTNYKRAAKSDEIFVLFEKLKERHPEVIELDLYWAQVLYEQKDYEGALAHLQLFLKSKETAEADYWMAMTCERLKKTYKAETYIKRAIKWEPQNALYRHFFAGLLYNAWRFTEALKEADAAVRASHNKNPWYLDRKAWILYRMKHYDESIEVWKSATGLKPGHKAFRRNIDMAAKAAKEA
ncbi:MAG: hypothetical protein BA865_07270 [Desulfobacterales bacterium S5133MH4]|nr:MAG: hypothetical protein BA865_07270 [Desulfobacterales bacterium S5133MH4]